MTRIGLIAAGVFLLLFAGTPSRASTVLYDNGVGSGTLGSSSISFGNIQTDTFTLTGASILTGVDLGLWVHTTIPADSPASLKWRITPSLPDDFNLGPLGTTAVLTGFQFCSGCATDGTNAFDIYASSFSLPNLALDAGTYFLTLDFGETAGFDSLFWDVNNGPSIAYRNGANLAGSITLTPGSNSDTFDIRGDLVAPPTTTPEPASTAIFLSGLALVAGLARRKMRA